MALNGSSRWNGKYGSEESKRRNGYRLAGNEPKYGPKGTVRALPIRSSASLNRAIREADSDEELASIRKRLEGRGMYVPPGLED